MPLGLEPRLVVLAAMVTLLPGCATDEWVARQYGEPEMRAAPVQGYEATYAEPAPAPAGATYQPEYGVSAGYEGSYGASYETSPQPAGASYGTAPASPYMAQPVQSAPEPTSGGFPTGYVPSVGAGGSTTGSVMSPASTAPAPQPAAASAGVDYEFIIEGE